MFPPLQCSKQKITISITCMWAASLRDWPSGIHNPSHLSSLSIGWCDIPWHLWTLELSKRNWALAFAGLSADITGKACWDPPQKKRRIRIRNRKLDGNDLGGHDSSGTPASPPVAPTMGRAGERGKLPEFKRPFMGDYNGFFWNTQALYAADPDRESGKMHIAEKLLESRDFGGFAETHSSAGKVFASNWNVGRTSFWSHGTNRQAGIGISLNNKFLENFNPVSENDWEVIVPGWIGKLSLKGPHAAWLPGSHHCLPTVR